MFPFYITSHFHNFDDAVYSSQPMVPIYHTTLYHNPCKHIRLSLLGSLLCTQQLVPQNCVQELLSETRVNIWTYFQQHSKFLHLWTINGLKEILQRIHSWEWAFYENSVANVEVTVFWDETTCSSEQGSSVLRKMEISRDWKTLAPTCQMAWHHNLQVRKPKWFDIFRTDTGTHAGVWRMKPRYINGV